MSAIVNRSVLDDVRAPTPVQAWDRRQDSSTGVRGRSPGRCNRLSRPGDREWMIVVFVCGFFSLIVVWYKIIRY